MRFQPGKLTVEKTLVLQRVARYAAWAVAASAVLALAACYLEVRHKCAGESRERTGYANLAIAAEELDER